MSFFTNNQNNGNRGHKRGGGNGGFSNDYNSFAQRLGGSGSGSGNGNGGSNFGNNTSRIEVRNWQGGSRDDLVSFIHRKSKIRLQDVQVNGVVLRARVSRNEGAVLENYSGIRFAGASLDIRVFDGDDTNSGFNSRPPSGPSGRNSSDTAPSGNTSSTIQLLEEYLANHYNPDIKFLNLENIPNDQFLISSGLLSSASTQSKMFPALMKVASVRITNVESASLANNGLSDLQVVTTLAATFPQLKNLSLANNNFVNVSSLSLWRHKFPQLRELILSGNPITTTPSYKDDMIKLFPRLIVLDGQVVQDESKIGVINMPLKVQQNFFENGEIGNIAGNFLSTFFDLYDRDRSQLIPLYDDQSTFTIDVNSSALRQLGGPGSSGGLRNGPSTTNTWGEYVPVSRNLSRVTAVNNKISRLYIGPQAISNAFQRLPSTQHDLKSPEKFAVDAWSVKDVRSVGDQAIMIFVHGEYTEQKNQVVHSFDRSLIIVPGPTGNMVVSSDNLTVRPYAGYDGWKPSSDTSSVPSQPAVSVQPLQTPPAATGSLSSLIDPESIKDLSPSQQLVLRTLIEKTRLTVQYARMCAEQAQYDLQRSLQLFEESKVNLPPDAFFQ